MTETLSQISKKYDKYYFGFKDTIKTGQKVVYIPTHDNFIYYYHDNGYIRDKFSPGDRMTVKQTKKSDHPPRIVFVNENSGVFSPKELIPAEIVDKEDIDKVREFYNEYKKCHKLR